MRCCSVGDGMLINGDAGWSRRLIGDWDPSGMEEDGRCCSCGGGAPGPGSLRDYSLIRFLQRRESRLQLMAQVLALALLLLLSLVLAVLITVLGGGRGQQPPASQPAVQPFASPSSGTDKDQQQYADLQRPSAMLTAACNGNLEDGYLTWESKKGNAFCRGGFNYSRGSLVVPRAGLYRVFLQVTYESNAPCENKKLVNSVLHFRDSYREDVTLLTSTDMVGCNTEKWIKSLYAAGLFLLEANSRLRVRSSNPEFIVRREHEVFFGAELLPE